MIYRDTDNQCLYVVTKIGISHSFHCWLCSQVARKSSGLQICEVEKMVKEFHQTNYPIVFSNGEVAKWWYYNQNH